MACNYVIVISVLEGKNFPTRHDKYLLVEAKFDGEVMATDPAPHILRPHFNTELAWEVDKKGLQMHRLQRSPIKLQWYAVDVELTKKETIGYMILDIRLAQEKLQSPKWYPLLNSKYQKEKPEVLLSLYLERVTDDGHHTESNNSKRNSFSEDRYGRRKPSNSDGHRAPHRPINDSSNGLKLKPVLVPNAGYYQIGSPDLCTEKFNFSVTIAFAANLNKLAPPAMLKSSKGFYFYYLLFDNHVTTEKFSSLSNPDFLAERASVRIRSNSQLLSEYFQEHPSLEIVLFSGEISLGSGQIPLGPFSCVSNHNIHSDPLCVEGSVQIIPTEKTSRRGGDDLSPFVGVTVVLQADEPEDQNCQKQNSSVNYIDSPPDEKPEQSMQESCHFVTKTAHSNPKIPANNERSSNHKVKNNTPPSRDSHAPTPNGAADNEKTPCSHSSVPTPLEAGDAYNFNVSPLSIPMKMDSSARHFSFTLDLCNFQATRLSHSINLFIRYSYPFFGTTSSMVTHPDVEVHPKCEVSIPHGYCAFNFATPFALLKSTFWETPLILEVLHRKKGGQEQIIGTARVNLFQVLDAPSVSHIVDKKRGMRQLSSCKVVVTSPEGYEIGEIYAVLTLIDFGRTSALCDRHSTQTSIPHLPQVHNFIPNFDISLLRQNGLTQDELLQAALELELWQERQREIFRSQLKDKEKQHLSVLTSEWKQRDMERELLLQKQLQECQKLEDKLKTTLKDAEMKEKQLSSQEAELSRRLQHMDRQREQQQKETKNRIDSMKLEYNELLAHERLKMRELEQKNSSLSKQVKELERDLQDQKSLVDSLRSQLNKGPDVHLRTEVNILNMEKSELQQKLEAALCSKQKYKIQWGQAVRQNSLLQQKILELTRKNEEIAAIQQQMLTFEEKNAVQTKDGINEILKDQVESLKSLVSPESAKMLDRQMSLNINNAQSHPSVPSSCMVVNSHHSDSSSAKSSPLTTTSNTILNCTTDGFFSKPNTNSIVNVSASDNVKHHFKSSLIPQPIKHLPDCNGNTNGTESNLHVQNLLSKKEVLLTSGYTEDDQLIKDLNLHIEKAKPSSK